MTGVSPPPGAARRGVFDVDAERALEALRLDWGGVYTICFDDAPGGGRAGWRAWRVGGSGTAITGTTPDELNAAVRADWARRSTPC